MRSLRVLVLSLFAVAFFVPNSFAAGGQFTVGMCNSANAAWNGFSDRSADGLQGGGNSANMVVRGAEDCDNSNAADTSRKNSGIRALTNDQTNSCNTAIGVNTRRPAILAANCTSSNTGQTYSHWWDLGVISSTGRQIVNYWAMTSWRSTSYDDSSPTGTCETDTATSGPVGNNSYSYCKGYQWFSYGQGQQADGAYRTFNQNVNYCGSVHGSDSTCPGGGTAYSSGSGSCTHDASNRAAVASTATRRPRDCYVTSGGVGIDYDQSQLTTTGQGIRGVKYNLECRPDAGWSSCLYYGRYGNYSDYSARYNIYDARFTVQDNFDPNVSASGGLWTNGIVSGTQSASMSATDNSGIRTMAFRMDSAGWNSGTVIGGIRNNAGACRTVNAASTTYDGNGAPTAPGRYGSFVPCSNMSGQNSSLNTASYQDGPHTVRAVAIDPAGNQGNIAATPVFDNCRTGATGCPTRNNAYCSSIAVNDPPATVNGWIRNTIAVTGTACDAPGGVANGRTQVSINGGGWQDLPSCTGTSASSGVTATTTCQFDTTPYAEGTPVVFRMAANDSVGNGDNYSGNSATRYIDNTPPAVNGLGFTPTLQASDGKRWTNGGGPSGSGRPGAYNDNTGASWTVSRISGSPIVNTYTQYTPGSCGVQAVRTYSGAQTSEALANNPAGCQQGRHQLNVWATDEAGNTSTSSYNGAYYFDSVAPAAPTNDNVNPSSWTTVNNYTLTWTAPTFNNTTESPNQIQYSRFPQQDSDPAGTATSCLGSGATCTLSNVVIPGTPQTGIYYYKVWYSDFAGNRTEVNNALLKLYYQSNTSTGGGDPTCVVN
jgi:hypothetical protein